MKRIIFAAFFIIFLAGSANAEKYIGFINTVNTYVKEVQDIDQYYTKGRNKIAYGYTIISFTLDIEKDRDAFSGTLVITDEKMTSKIALDKNRSGYIDDKMHLVSILDENTPAEIIYKYGRIRRNFKKYELILTEAGMNEKGGIIFDLAVKVPSPGYETEYLKNTIVFEEYTGSYTEHLNGYKERLQEQNISEIKEYIKYGSYRKAAVAKDLLYSAGGELDIKLAKEFALMKERYKAGLEEEAIKKIEFKSRVKFFDDGKGSERTAFIEYDLKNGSKYAIRKIKYDIIYLDGDKKIGKKTKTENDIYPRGCVKNTEEYPVSKKVKDLKCEFKIRKTLFSIKTDEYVDIGERR